MPAPQGVSGPMPRLAELLAEALRAQGCDVSIVPWGGGGGRSLPARLIGRGREVNRVRRAASRLKPDAILVQTSHDWVCVLRDTALALAVRRHGSAIVLQFHGSRSDILVGPGRPLFKLATRLLLRLVDGVFVLSSEEQRALESFAPNRKSFVVTNPFVPANTTRRIASANGDLPVVLFASRLLAQKGILDTVEAFAILRQRVPARLVVAGDGPAAAEVDRLVRERGLSEDVTLVGRLPPESLAESYRRADVFVLPTYDHEGFPTVISEAMGAGLPVVTSRTRGNADHLVEGTNALFVPPRDPPAVAQALERLLTEPELRKQMGQANRRKVKEFAPERVARTYVRALGELVPASPLVGDIGVRPEALAAGAREAFELGRSLDWKSHDPYDLLLSRLGHAVQTRSWLGARVVVQVGRRTGSGVRRILGVPEHAEPKALAEFLRAAALLGAAGADWTAAYGPELARRLVECSVATPHGRGWGLDFPYASRFISVERGTPNLYVTTVACQALLDHHQLTRDPSALHTAVEGCRLILDGLGSFEHDGRPWLRYWRGLDTPTVNVQASAASMLARAGAVTGDDRLLRWADAAAGAAVAAQRQDGSWPYSVDGRADFVDGFHTGFTLQGLAEYAAERGSGALAGTTDAVARGFDFFTEHLLTEEGLPRGLADGKVSLEGQNVAQCVQTLVVCSPDARHHRHAHRLWQLGLARRLAGRGTRFPELRWTVAPAVLATAYLFSSRSSSA
jgi:glycosyltransferase involved in cell wall biosynthesis